MTEDQRRIAAAEIRIGQAVKLHNAYCAVVLDKYNSDAGDVVLLRVQTLRNVFRGFRSEIIDLSVSPNGIYPATMADIAREIEEHNKVVSSGLEAMLSAIKQGEST